jgi:hypothetical protein
MQVLNKKMTSQATTSDKLVRRHFLVGSFLFGVVQLLGSCSSSPCLWTVDLFMFICGRTLCKFWYYM